MAKPVAVAGADADAISPWAVTRDSQAVATLKSNGAAAAKT